jgi:broad specificity phosphatase PhoE/transposase
VDDKRLRRHDLSDAEWDRLAPLLPADPPRGGRWLDHRMVINGVFHRTRAGCAWRDLSPWCGNWKTVYNRYRRWSLNGTWEKIIVALRAGCVIKWRRFRRSPSRDDLAREADAGQRAAALPRWLWLRSKAVGELILIRHGETEYSRTAQLGGRTDLPMTDAGVAAAKALAPALAPRHLVAVFSSPLSRAMHTAELIGLTGVKPDPDLLEWDYGGYEGMTEAQIEQRRPGWNLWRDGVIPGDVTHPGEQIQQVAARVDAVLARVRPLLNDGDVALIGHGHLQRILAARWLSLDASAGRLFRHPHAGTVSALGTEHEQPVISVWNVL